MPSSDGYNGWKNHETWCVKLHLDNTESSYREMMARVESARERALTCSQVADGIWTVQQAARFLLADDLQAWVDEILWPTYHDGDTESFRALLTLDLLRSAFRSVDFQEIADSLLADVAEGVQG